MSEQEKKPPTETEYSVIPTRPPELASQTPTSKHYAPPDADAEWLEEMAKDSWPKERARLRAIAQRLPRPVKKEGE